MGRSERQASRTLLHTRFRNQTLMGYFLQGTPVQIINTLAAVTNL